MKNLPADILKDFPSLHAMGTRAYLDSAASSLTPTPVVAAMDAYYAECRANVHRGMYRTSGEASERYEQARAKAAKFLNAETEEIVFTRGATEALNLLAYTLCQGLQSGDEIVTTEMEHHANLVPWQQMAASRGVALKFIPVKSDFTLDMDAARALIGPKTKIVTVVHASNVLGTVNPVKEIAALAHAAGAVMIVDAAQSIGHRHIDVRELGCDFLAFSGHKMLAPMGIGVLWAHGDVLASMPPYQAGSNMAHAIDLESEELEDAGQRFCAGTPNASGAIALAAAINHFGSLGRPAIERHESELSAHALEALQSIPGLRILGPRTPEARVPVFSFVVEGRTPLEILRALDEEGIAIRAGDLSALPLLRRFGVGAAARASCFLYTRPDEIDRMVRVLRHLVVRK